MELKASEHDRGVVKTGLLEFFRVAEEHVHPTGSITVTEQLRKMRKIPFLALRLCAGRGLPRQSWPQPGRKG